MRGLLTFVVGFAGLAIVVALAIGVYYAISYLVLSLISRIFPLTGRRRR